MGSVLSKHEKHLQVDPLLLEVADVMATSLDLDTTLRRVAEVVRKVIDYEIFAILLLNEKTQELRFRFQVGYPAEFAERARIKVGVGVTGLAAQQGQTILIDDVTQDPRYVAALPNVRSELAVPLIYKNRVIGVIDLEARDPGYFNEEHSRLLSLIAASADSADAERDRARVDLNPESGRTVGADRGTAAALDRFSDVQHPSAGCRW
jgi:sigma-B regulation protein RsbU (phosphoserine phosphatase)